MSRLGRLSKVELRDIWRDEARDFTPWLAEADNLALLGETVGMALELEAVEKDVGPFRADILCTDVATGRKVLVENQLERTDHRHLGQVLTYAAGLDTATIIWVASQFTEEHRATLDWLNRITEQDFHFVGLEVELWRIGNSEPAPKFNLISKPNDWSKLVAERASSSPNPALASRRQFWEGFIEYVAENSEVIRPGTPSERHYMNFGLGKTGAALACIASFWNSHTNNYSIPELRCALVLTDSAKSADHLRGLLAERDTIEAEIGFELLVSDPEETVMKQLYVRTDADFREPSEWPGQYQWLLSHLEPLHRVFGPRVKKF